MLSRSVTADLERWWDTSSLLALVTAHLPPKAPLWAVAGSGQSLGPVGREPDTVDRALAFGAVSQVTCTLAGCAKD